ncbi:hypothetical protein Shyd_84900 [Streptomyces hydrogenans]|uniref:STAS domain-containing protein n=1 Tax=Streptomyces hydrogenans TaxID=1873719 RepID=A0ABQ3PCG8_9ACTN|nr:STAS domain-containing protein [Streptomyces hydrogenans]GHE26042.1 hypothetical protein GCM10018784_75150 [Streptomyces hydrogenans]GHI20438.1 hypothetical protein Shyd_18090 [Streptomyces hydrogenans]GHI20496.1 hypothetical protein Shyd_18670 [Streptomyces hydrogenans]GHI22719.1 hypothetical protein Shyd_40900 [Streptomyces hydrogenans]GHI22743.1 hypothetical protein Shyd_41140 [Streptomyces hydrogenans]
MAGPCVVAKVHGAMDYTSQQELREQLKQVIAHAERAVVVDLAEVSFSDSSGLNVLLRTRHEAEKPAWRWSWPACRAICAGFWRSPEPVRSCGSSLPSLTPRLP